MCCPGDGGFGLSLSLVMPLWDAPREQRELPRCASCPRSTRGGLFPFIDALLFPAVAGRGAFQEGDEEARLNGLKSGFIYFLFFFYFWDGRPGSCFSLTVSRWCCWNTKISSVFGMAAAETPQPPWRFLCSSTILQA